MPSAPPKLSGLADILWHGLEPRQPDWSIESQVIAYSLDGRFNSHEQDPDYQPDRDFYVAINGGRSTALFRIPVAPSGREWHRVVDTAPPTPQDFVPEDEGPIIIAGHRYPVAAFSLLVLVSEADSIML